MDATPVLCSSYRISRKHQKDSSVKFPSIGEDLQPTNQPTDLQQTTSVHTADEATMSHGKEDWRGGAGNENLFWWEDDFIDIREGLWRSQD
ncbi:hypothetical protein E2C01_036633 [Portunus trituberculatus]|uniref:Uncharacterized protein n=1 Tax=Portunus trituberculatus TaxID=210409 RepID=A0A5B7FD05_PORTR|nr:hypothetical protein [Portunus trituberculatus]